MPTIRSRVVNRWARPGAMLLPCLAVLAGCLGEPTVNGKNSSPTATLTSPAAGSTYRAGDRVTVTGQGNDPEDGALPDASLSWWAVFHHNTHTHPYLPSQAGGSGEALIPNDGETSADVFYRFYLRAVDADGAADTTWVDVHPVTATLHFATVPTGLTIDLDGQPHVTPYQVVGVAGMLRRLNAPSPQSPGGVGYAFDHWSDAGAASHDITTPTGNPTYTATFIATGTTNQPPTVSLTAPAGGAVLTSGATVPMTATAADADGTIAGVEFQVDGATVATDATSPYSGSWMAAGVGAHTLTARATDDQGAVTTSAVVNVTVQNNTGGDTEAPVVQLTAPTDGTQGLTGALNLTATATDNVGVTLVEFLVDGEVVGSDASSPYAAALPSTAVYTTGIHVAQARARDAAGNWSTRASARVTFGGATDLPAGFTRTALGSGFTELPTSMAFLPDGRLLICEQGGRLRLVKNGQLLTTNFAVLPTTRNGERGLLGITVDPSFATNGYVYVYYTATDASGSHNRVSRLTAVGDVAAAASELVLIDLPLLSGANNHNGGAIHFGPDGKLYVAVGDNANAQNAPLLTSLFGKLLRYNPDGSIPADNPLVGVTTGINQAIWAYGLRNPYTFGFQPGSGRLFINDVGQNAWEEIDEGIAGANYGWPATEGATTNPAYVSPLYTYGHTSDPVADPSLVDGFAIIGAAFYNPAVVLFPAAYTGTFFFGDYVSGWINRLDPANGNAVYAFARAAGELTDLAVGPDGALYALHSIAGAWSIVRYAH
jgi:glucose/arabinose dehydrogenase